MSMDQPSPINGTLKRGMYRTGDRVLPGVEVMVVETGAANEEK